MTSERSFCHFRFLQVGEINEVEKSPLKVLVSLCYPILFLTIKGISFEQFHTPHFTCFIFDYCLLSTLF